MRAQSDSSKGEVIWVGELVGSGGHTHAMNLKVVENVRLHRRLTFRTKIIIIGFTCHKLYYNARSSLFWLGQRRFALKQY